MRTLSICVAFQQLYQRKVAQQQGHCGCTDTSVHSALTICQWSMLVNMFHVLLTACTGYVVSYAT